MPARWKCLLSLSLGTLVGVSGCHSCGSCGKKPAGCCPPPGARVGAPPPMISAPPAAYPAPLNTPGSPGAPAPAWPATPAPAAPPPAFSPSAPPPAGARTFYGPVTAKPKQNAPAAAGDGWTPIERPDIRLSAPEPAEPAPASGQREVVPSAVAAAR